MKKVAVITGASRGIGRETALYLAEMGWSVVVNYHSSKDKAVELVSYINERGGDAVSVCADVGCPDRCKELIETAYEKYGRIDALINNAAIDEMMPFDMLSPEREKRLFDVNLFGTMNCTRYALPYMISAKSGSIVNVSSIWGRIGASCEVQYSTSKAALIGFTKALAKEVALSGIRVNCVAPGVIDTDMNSNVSKEDMDEFITEVPMGRMGTPREVAECIYFLCSSGYVTGQVLGVDGGYI